MKAMLDKKEKNRRKLSLLSIFDMLVAALGVYMISGLFSLSKWVTIGVAVLFFLFTVLEYLNRYFFLIREAYRFYLGIGMLVSGESLYAILPFLVLCAPLALYLLSVWRHEKKTETQTLYGNGEA